MASCQDGNMCLCAPSPSSRPWPASYWAKGSKSLGVKRERIRLSINAYTNNGLSIDDIEAHWLRAVGLPRSCVRKHIVDHTPASSSGRAKNRLVYGVCSLYVHSTHALQHI